MGIAGLARHIEPYASRYTPEQLVGYQAIIDGPSLAYHAHALALAAVSALSSAQSSTQSRIPSYADINAQAIRWLKALEAINIKVSAILFDGALPDTKRVERLSRLESNNQRVRNFRANYPTAAGPIPTYLGSVSYSLLAPALREALCDSEYASIARMVPGEADDWCAPCANDNPRSVVFSSDTDLLLYDYPTEGLVMFFRDVDLWPEPKFKGYAPAKMRQTLDLTSLVALAYQISLDPGKPFNTLVEDTRSNDNKDHRYEEFSKRYTPRSMDLRDRSSDPLAWPTIQRLDVRVSEFVHQSQSTSLVPVIYLPLLVEDPNQGSAWRIGQDTRLLAYSLLAPERQTAEEYRRKAQAVSVHKLQLYPPKELPAAIMSLAHDVSAWLQWGADRQVPKESMWLVIATSIVLQELSMPPKIALLVRVLTGDFDNTWDFIHLTAYVHAVLYSYRFLKQCIAVSLEINHHDSTAPRQHIDNLYRDLRDMPAIADLFFVPGQARNPRGNPEMLRRLIGDIYASANIEVPDGKSNKKLKRQKREAERKEKKRVANAKPSKNNLFGHLDPG